MNPSTYYQGKTKLNNQTVKPTPLLIKKLSCQLTSSPQLNWAKLTTKAIKLANNKLPINDRQGFFFLTNFW